MAIYFPCYFGGGYSKYQSESLIDLNCFTTTYMLMTTVPIFIFDMAHSLDDDGWFLAQSKNNLIHILWNSATNGSWTNSNISVTSFSLVVLKLYCDLLMLKTNYPACPTAGENLIEYLHEVATQTTELFTAKILWNSVLSNPHAKYICSNGKSYYLTTPMDHFEYMHMSIKLIPQSFIDEYDLPRKIRDGFVYMEIRNSMYGLPQAGILVNQLFKIRLAM